MIPKFATLTICRTGFCEWCQKENRPHTGQRAMVQGNHGYHVITANHVPRWYGFTPHLYKIHKVIGENIVYKRLCCMDGCGVYLEFNQERNVFDYFLEDNWVRGMMTIADWNALCTYKRDTDYFV